MRPAKKLTMTGELIEDLRVGLYDQISRVAEKLDELSSEPDREHHPERYQKPLANLDRTRALLAVIGWRSTTPPESGIDVNLRDHEWALTKALESMLRISIDNDRSHGGADPYGPKPAQVVSDRTKRLLAFTEGLRSSTGTGRQ